MLPFLFSLFWLVQKRFEISTKAVSLHQGTTSPYTGALMLVGFKDALLQRFLDPRQSFYFLHVILQITQ